MPVRADLDCGQIADVLTPIRVTGSDKFGLDADRDGLGCEIGGQGGGAKSPWGLILREPPRKEAVVVKVDDTLSVAGWSPSLSKGQRYEHCMKKLEGAPRDVSRAVVRIVIRVNGPARADDGVAVK